MSEITTGFYNGRNARDGYAVMRDGKTIGRVFRHHTRSPRASWRAEIGGYPLDRLGYDTKREAVEHLVYVAHPDSGDGEREESGATQDRAKPVNKTDDKEQG